MSPQSEDETSSASRRMESAAPGSSMRDAIDSLSAWLAASNERANLIETRTIATQAIEWLRHLVALIEKQDASLQEMSASMRAFQPYLAESLPRLVVGAIHVRELGGPEKMRDLQRLAEEFEAHIREEKALTNARISLSRKLASQAPGAGRQSGKARQDSAQKIHDSIIELKSGEYPNASAIDVANELYSNRALRDRVFGDDMSDRAVKDHLKKALKLPYGTHIRMKTLARKPAEE